MSIRLDRDPLYLPLREGRRSSVAKGVLWVEIFFGLILLRTLRYMWLGGAPGLLVLLVFVFLLCVLLGQLVRPRDYLTFDFGARKIQIRGRTIPLDHCWAVLVLEEKGLGAMDHLKEGSVPGRSWAMVVLQPSPQDEELRRELIARAGTALPPDLTDRLRQRATAAPLRWEDVFRNRLWKVAHRVARDAGLILVECAAEGLAWMPPDLEKPFPGRLAARPGSFEGVLAPRGFDVREWPASLFLQWPATGRELAPHRALVGMLGLFCAGWALFSPNPSTSRTLLWTAAASFAAILVGLVLAPRYWGRNELQIEGGRLRYRSAFSLEEFEEVKLEEIVSLQVDDHDHKRALAILGGEREICCDLDPAGARWVRDQVRRWLRSRA